MYPLSTACLVGLIVALPGTYLHAQDQPTSGPISLEVKLPAGAVLEIDGAPTRSTGEVRIFETEPVPLGRPYAYQLRATWQGKEVRRRVEVRPNERVRVDLVPDFEKALAPPVEPVKPAPAPKIVEGKFPKPGFVTFVVDGRLWVFRTGSKELEEFRKQGDLGRFASRIKAGPEGMTIRAPDLDTLIIYLGSRPGFEVFLQEGRLWVLRAGSKELEEFKKHGELAKAVIRVNAAPLGLTLKAPDAATLDDYLKAGQR